MKYKQDFEKGTYRRYSLRLNYKNDAKLVDPHYCYQECIAYKNNIRF